MKIIWLKHFKWALILMYIANLLIIQESYGQKLDYGIIQSEYSIFEPASLKLIEGCYNCPSGIHFIGVRVDSTKSGDGYQSYFFSSEIVEKDPYCYIIGPSVFGDSIVEESGGISRCYTFDSIEIIINRNLAIGESNLLCSFNNGDYVTATVTSHGVESFLDVSDSVKTYSLQLFDSNNVPLDGSVNTMYLKISKSFGLIHCFNFRDFPEVENVTTSLDLVSTGPKGVNSLNITYGEIYDFDLGDEFHYRIEQTSPYPGESNYSIKQVINKNVSSMGDTIVYTFTETRFGSKGVPNSNPITYESYCEEENIMVTYSNLNAFVLIPDLMPNEAYLFEEHTLSNSLMYRNEDVYNNRYTIRKNGHELYYHSGCGSPPLDSWGGTFTYYIVGCGHLINTLSVEIEENCYPCEHLVYFKKGEETWGEPLTVGIQNYNEFPKTELYPNPAKNIVSITSIENIRDIVILSYLGKKIKPETYAISNSFDLNISNLESGIYILVITLQNGDITTKKLIVY